MIAPTYLIYYLLSYFPIPYSDDFFKRAIDDRPYISYLLSIISYLLSIIYYLLSYFPIPYGEDFFKRAIDARPGIFIIPLHPLKKRLRRKKTAHGKFVSRNKAIIQPLRILQGFSAYRGRGPLSSLRSTRNTGISVQR